MSVLPTSATADQALQLTALAVAELGLFDQERLTQPHAKIQMKTKTWLYVWLAIVAMFTSSGSSFAFPSSDHIPFALLVPIFGAAYFSAACSLKRAHRSEHARHNWETPTWFTNPFSGAAQFFHMAGCCFMGLGLVATILAAVAGHDIVLPAFPAVVGFAIYLGIRRFYRHLGAANAPTT